MRAPRGRLYRRVEGRWQFDAGCYSAEVDAFSGRLVGLRVDGESVLAQRDPDAAGATLFEQGRAFEPCLCREMAHDALMFADGNFLLQWRFLPDAVVFEYGMAKGHETVMRWFFSDQVGFEPHWGPIGPWQHEPVQYAEEIGDSPLWHGDADDAVDVVVSDRVSLTLPGPHLDPVSTPEAEGPRSVQLPLADDSRRTGRLRIIRPATEPANRVGVCLSLDDPQHLCHGNGSINVHSEFAVIPSQDAPTPTAETPAESASPVSDESDHPGQATLYLRDFTTQQPLTHQQQAVSLSASGSASRTWSLPWHEPGVYELGVWLAGGQAEPRVLGERRLVLAYNLPRWRPPLYRPDDFWPFWETALSEMRSLPLEPELHRDEARSGAEQVIYDVEVTGYACRRIRARFAEPTIAAQRLGYGQWAGAGGSLGSDTDADRDSSGQLMAPLTCPADPQGDEPLMFPVLMGEPELVGHIGGPHLWLQPELPDQGRFRQGVSNRFTSNLLFCILDTLRWLDFLGARGHADFGRCVLAGRGEFGLMAVAASALDERVKLLTLDGAICNRWDWQIRHTGGHGPWSSSRAPGQSEDALIRELAYFDASHFAERVRVPTFASWGMLNRAVPISGPLSMWAHLPEPKELELRPWSRQTGWTQAFADQVAAAITGLCQGEAPVNHATG